MHLFMRERDPHDELWNGPRTGVHQSRDIFGADEVSDINEFPRALRSALKKASHVYADLRPYGDYSSQRPFRKPSKSFLAYITRAVTSSDDEAAEDILKRAHPQSLLDRVAPLRKIKSPAERKLMRQAGDVSGTAHAKTMRFAQSAQSEAQLAAHFEYFCALKGAQRPAYVPVVASGANALIIHYTNNDCLLKLNELVLMDAGCELNGYASDITRTFPVGPSGSFSAPQKELYAAVLGVQKELISLCTENARQSLNSLHAKSVEGLGKALTRIGFDLGPGNRRLDRLYPHFLSHPIGIDLHETNGQRHQYLVEGQVITIEPGVYVPPDPVFPKWFHNIGIRIEDEVLVDQDGAHILTVNAPKEIADIEAGRSEEHPDGIPPLCPVSSLAARHDHTHRHQSVSHVSITSDGPNGLRSVPAACTALAYTKPRPLPHLPPDHLRLCPQRFILVFIFDTTKWKRKLLLS
ncbi:hypothetical protein FRC12_017018, partial [Ceratobasidium sp. 428]